MKKNVIYLCLILIAVSGCASFKKGYSLKKGLEGANAAYSGPMAMIQVTDFDVKAAKANLEIGSALRQILTAALINSRRFSVPERQSAELIIFASVVEFEPEASGGSAGIGGGGGVTSGLLGGLLGARANKAHIALDIRISDLATSQVLASARVQGQASDITADAMGGLLGGQTRQGVLSAYADTPMEKAIRICMVEAARFTAQNVPEQYYKY